MLTSLRSLQVFKVVSRNRRCSQEGLCRLSVGHGAPHLKVSAGISKQGIARLFSKETKDEIPLNQPANVHQESARVKSRTATTGEQDIDTINSQMGDPSLVSLQTEFPALPVDAAYRVLGLPKTCSVEEIQDSYKKHAHRMNPFYRTDDLRFRELKRVNSAYVTLMLAKSKDLQGLSAEDQLAFRRIREAGFMLINFDSHKALSELQEEMSSLS